MFSADDVQMSCAGAGWLLWNDIKNQAQLLKEPHFSDILEDTKGYNSRYHAVLQHRNLLDWYKLHPFDIYMYSLQAEPYPET